MPKYWVFAGIIVIVLLAVLAFVISQEPTPPQNQSPIPSSQPTSLPSLQASSSVVGSPSSQQTTVKLYFLALEDQGKSGQKIGCGDSLVPISVEIPQTPAVLKSAYEKLFSLKDRFYGQSGLYNALYQSNLELESVTITNNTALVRLTGNFQLGGECDNPRVKAQLEQTALQFESVKSVEITINGKPLDEALSLK